MDRKIGDWRLPHDKENSPFCDTNSAHLQAAIFVTAGSEDQRNEFLANVLAEVFGRLERLEGLARHGRQGIPLGPVPNCRYFPED